MFFFLTSILITFNKVKVRNIKTGVQVKAYSLRSMLNWFDSYTGSYIDHINL